MLGTPSLQTRAPQCGPIIIMSKSKREVSKLLRLLLVMPATNATSERSFSALRRIKSYLRSTMTQQRMNHLMVLHIHKELTDKLDLVKTANALTSGNDHRHQIFGVFKSSDIAK